ncbi:MAG TPA: hypothetical protein VGE22_08285, partial [Solimonas sp.]
WSRMFMGMTDLTASLFDPRQTLRANLQRVAELGAERSGQGQSRKAEGLLYFVIQTITLSRPDLEKRVRELFEEAQGRLTQAIRNCPLERGERLRGSAELVAAHLAAHINGLSLLQFQIGRNYMQAQDLNELFVHMAIVRDV